MRHGLAETRGKRGRACISREDNGVPERGIFNAVETITVLSGIADRAPVFPEVRARQERPETRETLWRVPDGVTWCVRWLTTSRRQLTPLWDPTVSSCPTPYTSRVEIGRPRGARSRHWKKSRERERERVKRGEFNFQSI